MENRIIDKLCNLIKITNNSLDYILIEDLMCEYQDEIINDKYRENTIKKIIFNYLKGNVKLNKIYSSKVFGKYNKRGYVGISWQDSTKSRLDTDRHYHFFKYYDLNKLMLNNGERELFLQKVNEIMYTINWPPINIVFYMKVLMEDLKYNMEKRYINEFKEVKDIIPNKIDIFTVFLQEHLLLTENIKDIVFTDEILLKYTSQDLQNKSVTLTRELRNYILINFCNNDKNLLEDKFIYRTREKRGYRYIKLK